MPDATPAATRPTRGHWLLVHLLLAPAVVVPLLVPLYDKTDPTLFGFPFYYWFQFALIPCAAALTFAAYVVAKRANEIERGER